MKCYACDVEITKDNETEEHILLNAIGGKLKSKKLICKGCNSTFGNEIDASLARQLNPIANLLNIKRDRGKPQNVKGTYNNQDILVEPGGKLKLARAYTNRDGNIYHIEASSERQAKKALKGLKRKHPKINIEEEMKNATKGKSYLPSVQLGINFGGEETSRAFCKMAVNYFIYHGGKAEEIKHLLPYIKGNEKDAAVFYYYPKSEVFYKGEKEFLHTLLLVGDSQQKQLYVYIELFNEFKMVVFLNQEYEGSPIYESYHYNVITNEVVKYDNPIKIPSQQLKRYIAKGIDVKNFKVRLRQLLQRLDNVMVDNRINDITTNAMNELLEQYPQEEYEFFTEEMIHFLSRRVAEEYVMSFQHRLFR